MWLNRKRTPRLSALRRGRKKGSLGVTHEKRGLQRREMTKSDYWEVYNVSLAPVPSKEMSVKTTSHLINNFYMGVILGCWIPFRGESVKRITRMQLMTETT